MHYDAIVVGAGISGCTIAERFASRGHSVVIIEKRDHLGGNCYDYRDHAGILVPRYGPHFFHTNDRTVWDYVSRFTKWHPYEHRVLSYVERKLVPIPVNITTINMLFELNIHNEDEMKHWLAENTPEIKNPLNSRDLAISRVGRTVYEKMFKHYTKKQWNLWPEQLDASVLARIAVRTNSDDRYFTDAYQGMPLGGYTRIFERMVARKHIDVVLKTDYFESKFKNIKSGYLFFTGPVDHYFKGQNKLQYRSLRFKYENLLMRYFQPCAQVNYPNEYKYTRIIEPKHATGQKDQSTTIIKEYSTDHGEPYYPVPNARNHRIYSKYLEMAKRVRSEGIHFVGRLAQYKYMNMDQAFKNALLIAERVLSQAAGSR